MSLSGGMQILHCELHLRRRARNKFHEERFARDVQLALQVVVRTASVAEGRRQLAILHSPWRQRQGDFDQRAAYVHAHLPRRVPDLLQYRKHAVADRRRLRLVPSRLLSVVIRVAAKAALCGSDASVVRVQEGHKQSAVRAAQPAPAGDITVRAEPLQFCEALPRIRRLIACITSVAVELPHASALGFGARLGQSRCAGHT
mmetsp:Transcript_58853/g.164380  ORF Transcript_58853/g.164380 Transcript_58853/m.164380 type:complete len:201 (-) Transcript_58853:2-604(-)